MKECAFSRRFGMANRNMSKLWIKHVDQKTPLLVRNQWCSKDCA
jgi:hypothetical protein